MVPRAPAPAGAALARADARCGPGRRRGRRRQHPGAARPGLAGRRGLEYGEEGAGVAPSGVWPMLRGDATALPVADASLDLVVAFDVLEHIEDDDAAVARGVSGRCARAGRFLVAVPCDPRLWSAHDEAVGHVRRYTRDDAARAAAARRLRASRPLRRGTCCCARWSRCAAGPAAAATWSDLPRWSTPGCAPSSPPSATCRCARLPGVSLLVTARRP